MQLKYLNHIRLNEFNLKIDNTSDEELFALIEEASKISHMEESLAQSFLKRKLDTSGFSGVAKFRTTKMILNCDTE